MDSEPSSTMWDCDRCEAKLGRSMRHVSREPQELGRNEILFNIWSNSDYTCSFVADRRIKQVIFWNRVLQHFDFPLEQRNMLLDRKGKTWWSAQPWTWLSYREKHVDLDCYCTLEVLLLPRGQDGSNTFDDAPPGLNSAPLIGVSSALEVAPLRPHVVRQEPDVQHNAIYGPFVSDGSSGGIESNTCPDGEPFPEPSLRSESKDGDSDDDPPFTSLQAFMTAYGIADINARAPRRVGRGTLLHLAILGDELGVCERILASPEFNGINKTDKHKQTALHLAAACGYDDLCLAISRHEKFRRHGALDVYGSTAQMVSWSAPECARKAELGQ